MTVETATYPADLNAAYPDTADGISEGDDHLRLLKSVLKTAFGTLGDQDLDTTLAGYLTTASAASTYLSQASAASTYLTQANAASTYLPFSGGTLTGSLTLSGAPSVDLHAATKKYVDDTVAGGGVTQASTADYRAKTNTSYYLGSSVWDAAAEVTLTDAASITVNMATFLNAKVTLGANRALANPTNVKVGQSGAIRVFQDGTGSRTLSFGTYYKFAAGSAPTLTTTASAYDVLFYHVLSATEILISTALNVS